MFEKKNHFLNDILFEFFLNNASFCYFLFRFNINILMKFKIIFTFYTPLSYALMNDNFDVAKLFLQNPEADLKIKFVIY